jgi:hypothetical protein
MKYVLVGILIAVMACGHQVARASCENGNPTFELNVYENDNYTGDAINYKIYLNGGDYELAVSYVSLWWNNEISSFDTWDNYPAHWWMYDSSECAGTLFEEGDGNRSSLSYNDQVDSLKFRCPSDKDRTILTFYKDANYGGAHHPLLLYKHGTTDEVVIEMPELDGHWNDIISSIDTNRNGSTKHYYWYFYRNSNYNNQGDPDLILSDTDPDRASLPTSLNNKITSFRLVITDSSTAPTINAVPALSEWGMVALVLLLLASGTWILLRRRTMTNRSCPN